MTYLDLVGAVGSFEYINQILIFGTFWRKYLQNFLQPKLVTQVNISNHILTASFFSAFILVLIKKKLGGPETWLNCVLTLTNFIPEFLQ